MTLLRHRTLYTALALIFFISPAICQTFRTVNAGPLLGSNAIVRADFNRDGFPDLASVNNNSTVSILLSDHEGGFIRVDSPGGCCPLVLSVAADMNGDHNPDLLVAENVDEVDSNVILLLGNGNGTLQQSRFILSIPNLVSMFVTDFDRDGRRDVAVIYSTQGVGHILTLFGDGTGKFPRKSDTSLPVSFERAPVFVDVDNDGDTDVLFPCCFRVDQSTVVLLRNNGSGGFQQTFLERVEAVSELSAGDVNQDSVADLLISSGQPGEGLLSVLFNPGLSATRIEVALPNLADSTLSANYKQAVEADFDNDGYHDIAFPVQAAPRDFPGGPDPTFESIAFSRQRANGSFTAPVLMRIPVGTASLLKADFNNDGLVDLAYLDFSANVVVLINTAPVGPCEAGLGGGRGVHVCSPSPGAIDSPVRVLASPKSELPIQAMKIYVDGISRFTTMEDGISTRLNLSSGTHRLTVKAWDNVGAFGSTLNIDVKRGSACPASIDRTVVICSPSITSGTSMRVLAGLRSSFGIETAQVYVDHKLAYVVPTGRYYVDVTFTMPTGPHTVTVKGWDKNGAFSRSTNVDVH